MPLAVAAALSARTPNAPGIATDYEISSELTWQTVEASVLFERENDVHYYGYKISGDRTISEKWVLEYKTNIKTANAIDRQSVIVGRKWKFLGLGCGAVSERYSRPGGALDFYLPLPGGEITYTTNFRDVRILEAESIIGFKISAHVEPFLLGRFLKDGSHAFWQIKGGISFDLKGEEHDTRG